MLALRAVSKRFGEHTVLDGLSFELASGSVTALMGANGSGKTTVGRLLLGLVEPDSGSLEGTAGRRRAAVFQEDRLVAHLDAVENVRLSLPRGRRLAVTEHLERVGLTGKSLSSPVRELSGGQRRRVAIVRALASGAELLVLDEPFTGIDEEAKGLVMNYVRAEAPPSTLLITHELCEARWFGAEPIRLPARNETSAPLRLHATRAGPSGIIGPGAGATGRGHPRRAGGAGRGP